MSALAHATFAGSSSHLLESLVIVGGTNSTTSAAGALQSAYRELSAATSSRASDSDLGPGNSSALTFPLAASSDAGSSNQLVYEDAYVRWTVGRSTIANVTFFESVRPYSSMPELSSWSARQTLLHSVLATDTIYRMSLVPTNPSEPQTWFITKSLQEAPPSSRALSVGCVLRSLRVSDQYAGSSSLPEIKRGMLAPWSDFSSDLARPQYSPQELDQLPAEKIVVSEACQELVLAQSPQLNERLQRIARLFFQDKNSLAMLLVVGDIPPLEPHLGCIRRLLLTRRSSDS